MKFLYNKTSQIQQKNILSTAHRLTAYIQDLQKIATDNLYESEESSINAPFDTLQIQQIEDILTKTFSKRLKYVLVIGIGGSNLGTKAVYDALYGYFDVLQGELFPKILFMDTTNPSFADAIGDLLETQISSKKEILINIITKSGGTAETIANAEFVITELKKMYKKIEDRIVITTDGASPLYEIAVNKKLHLLTIPEKVGGRFSVFTPVALFPLAAVGIEIKKLLAGAKGMRDFCINSEVKKNPAALSAAVLYENYKNKKTIHDSFFFNAELESLGKWYRQLMGESIGKEGKGMTPTVSIGSTDLHSVAQLYLGGPNDKITTFIHSEKSANYPKVSQTRYFKNLVPSVTGKSFMQILEAIRKGVKKAYKKNDRAYMEIIFPDISEKSLGEFMQYKMLEIMYLAKLMKVNAFDQPSVELYKIETKKLLK